MVEGKPTNDSGFGKPVESRTEDTVIEPRKIAGFTLIQPGDEEIIDAGTDGSYTGGAGSDPISEPKRRGRKPGSTNKPRETETSSNLIANLESLLLSIHFMCANIVGVSELEIDPSEAKRLSDAIKNVSKHYAVTMDPRKLAIVELCCAAGGIYGPRAIAIIKKPRATSQQGPKLVPKQAAQPQPISTQSGSSSAAKVMNPSQVWDESPIESGGI